MCKILSKETTEVENPMLISVPPNAVVLLLMLSVLMRATRLRFDPRVDRGDALSAGALLLHPLCHI